MDASERGCGGAGRTGAAGPGRADGGGPADGRLRARGAHRPTPGEGVVVALAGLALLVPAVLTAVATKTGGGAPAAHATRLGTGAEFSYIGQGSDESGEAGRSAAQEDYENRAYPSDTIDFDQTLGAV